MKMAVEGGPDRRRSGPHPKGESISDNKACGALVLGSHFGADPHPAQGIVSAPGSVPCLSSLQQFQYTTCGTSQHSALRASPRQNANAEQDTQEEFGQLRRRASRGAGNSPGLTGLLPEAETPVKSCSSFRPP
jgi:hypothetical protein